MYILEESNNFYNVNYNNVIITSLNTFYIICFIIYNIY